MNQLGMKKRWKSTLGIVALSAVLGLTACSGGNGGGGGGGGGGADQIDQEEPYIAGVDDREFDEDATFRYGWILNPTNWDPHKAGNGWDMLYLGMVYDQLVGMDTQGNLGPRLATEWEFNDDGSTLTFKLRDDVDFTDGEHFDASVVKANIERAQTVEGGTQQGQLSVIESVDVVDDYTVRFNLNGPGANLPGLLSQASGSMISPAALDNPDLDQKPIGSGMSILTEYVPGNISRFDRNDNYWDPDVAKAAKYEIINQTSSPTRVNQLSTGELDMTWVLPQDRQSAVDSGFNVATVRSDSIFSFSLQTGPDNLFGDVRAREAWDLGIDRQALVDGVLLGSGTPLVQYLPPSNWAYDPDVTLENPDYEYNPERSCELLEEAGYPDGADMELMVPALDNYRTIAEALQPIMEKACFHVKTQVVEAVTTAEEFFVNFKMDAVFGESLPIYDPTQNFMGNLPGQFGNPWNTTSDEFIAAYEAALAETDQEKRVPLMHALVQEEKKLRRGVPLFQFAPPGVWTDQVILPEGYSPSYLSNFRGVGLAQE